ncbi:hypothetical protein G6M86_03780 [Agrobacterium tumefaciens]|uniref:DUF1382 family protein n=1 Tax=Agrobacterium tumefaciens TaxID=358 RepID=A0AAJ4T963_AGRTU|nr:hypothetical protein G6M86_03780 [Agrobacterium tumefaciens]
MSADFVTVAQIRAQLEIAHELAKSRIGFVVMPVLNKDAYRVHLLKQQVALQEVAQAAERAQEG